jgi:hypothetical protein
MSTDYSIGDPAPEPPRLRSESEITAGWAGDRPVVSILCSTFQHAAFIEDAIRGFLGQETDFPFEVLIRDDASADGTSDIVRDYAHRYPSIIRAVLETKNGWPDIRPMQVLRPLARGRFIAPCEGDDYWLDPRKLMLQVDHLTRTPNAVVSHHQSLIVQGGVITSLERLASSEQIDLDAQSLRRGGRLLTNTLLYRHGVIPQNPYVRGRYPSGIKFLRVAFGLVGDSVYTREVKPAVYRRHDGGISSGANPLQHQLDIASSHYMLSDFLARHGDLEAAEVHARKAVKALERHFQSLGIRPSAQSPVSRRQLVRNWIMRSRSVRLRRG